LIVLRNLLAYARVYSLFARAVGAERGRRLHIERYVRARAGDRVLDIGCGPADMLKALPAVEYVGFDSSAAYIESARKRFGPRGQFHVERLGLDEIRKYAGFDLVLATGVLHHLNDSEAVELFRVAQAALKPGGRLVTLDGCFKPGQSRIARQLLEMDRGEHVREEAAYVALARRVFPRVDHCVTTDLLRIPYTHLILECSGKNS
jgi:SAM-dependent methyltransferase